MKGVVAGAAAVITAGSGYLWLKSGHYSPIQVPAYHVSRVIDGDTFETDEKQTIRLAGIDAPEISLCGGQEAKIALEKLVLKKNIYLKVIYRDPYLRLIAWVYADNVFVNQAIVSTGWAGYHNRQQEANLEIAAADKGIRDSKAGIYSSKCTQETNIQKPECVIKGNVLEGRGVKIYHFPGCGQYKNTQVQLYLGDRWFCTEKEAVEAGFTKGSDCFDKKWN